MNRIISRVVISPGDMAYDQLAKLNGDKTAIRHRLIALIHMGVIAEGSLTTRAVSTAAPPIDLSDSRQTHPTESAQSADTRSTEKNKSRPYSVPTFNLDGLTG
ncbi:hypothetical protein ACFQAT_25720 [Undibacterium arcticum]|uniref:hypothetical protein n=1 Tax=Undibacterium arcticum TaxID=1762892 RepID=UPI00360E9216